MTIKGHLLLANNVVIHPIAIYSNLYNLHYIIIAYIIYIAGAAFVDIDEPKSYIGRKLFFISFPFRLLNNSIKLILILLRINNKAIHKLFEHRGITHLLIFPLSLILIANNFFENTNIEYSIYFFSAGVIIHQLGDLCTNNGIKNYLFPFFIGKNIKTFITYETGSLTETLINILFTILFLFQCYLNFKEFI